MKIGDSSLVDPFRIRSTHGAGGEKQAVEVGGEGLALGQVLKGRVASIDASGMLIVETDAGTFRATAVSALPVGREFLFQVAHAGGSPLLAEAGKANAVLNLLRVMLPGMFGLDGVCSKLTQEEMVRAFWDGHAMDGRVDPVKLAKTMVQFSQWQSYDRKSILPGTVQAGSAETLAAQKVSQLVDAHVLVNQTTGGSVGGDYVIFPIFFAEQAGKGEWLFSFDQREGGEVGADGEITNLSFYLAMSRLGDIHISLSTRPQSVSGVITLATAEAAEHVRQHLALLVQALERVTGAATVITCRSGPVDCLRALKDDLTSKVGVVGRYALIDVRT